MHAVYTDCSKYIYIYIYIYIYNKIAPIFFKPQIMFAPSLHSDCLRCMQLQLIRMAKSWLVSSFRSASTCDTEVLMYEYGMTLLSSFCVCIDFIQSGTYTLVHSDRRLQLNVFPVCIK